MSYKKITILGNVGAAPEIKKLPSGVIVANFSVATNERFMSKGEMKDITQWWRVDAFQKAERGLVTEVIQKYVGKGQMVLIEGSPEQEEWIGEDGAKKRGFKIRIGHPGSQLQLCGGPRTKTSEAGTGEGAPNGAMPQEGATAGTDEEIPF